MTETNEKVMTEYRKLGACLFLELGPLPESEADEPNREWLPEQRHIAIIAAPDDGWESDDALFERLKAAIIRWRERSKEYHTTGGQPMFSGVSVLHGPTTL
jgi:hypothetical protein